MRFDIITIFPEMFAGPFESSIIGKAREKGSVEINVHDLRDYTHTTHKITDDSPYGGGAGMVMKPEPIIEAVEDLQKNNADCKVALMTPQGKTLSHKMALELAELPGLIVICGRYEGVDERVPELCCDMEISIGDFVLTGGEIPAMALVDSVARLIPGVVKQEDSTAHDSHADFLLKHPAYTRPAQFRGLKVPDVLLSGDHAKIEEWRRKLSVIRTAKRRPDLLDKAGLTADEWGMVKHLTGENE